MKLLKSLIILFTCLGMSLTIEAAELTAEQVAQKTASLISASKGISATFTMKGNGRSGKGTIKNSGEKFSVILPDASIWYDGKDMYTYNPKTKETTVVKPTAQELLESNPLLYVKGGGGNYAYSFSSVKRSGKYSVELTPKNKKSGIRKMVFIIDSTNFHPEKIIVSTSNGDLTIEIDSFNDKASLPASDFVYPKSKYPKVEIVDLR